MIAGPKTYLISSYTHSKQKSAAVATNMTKAQNNIIFLIATHLLFWDIV